jgi:alkanesulfonate monooxygenase
VGELQFVAVAAAHASSEVNPALGAAVDPRFVAELARAHDAAGFDAVLAHDSGSSVDAGVLAGQVLGASSRIRVLVTHRPGVIAPTAVARQLAALDAFHPGRVGLHVPAVDSDRDAQRDGDWTDRSARQRRRGEFAEVMRRIWTSDRPVDFAGEFYTIAPTWTPIRPANPVEVHASGASVIADEFGAAYADTYYLPSLPTNQLVQRIGAASAVAHRCGRSLRFGLRVRPVLGATRGAAEDYARRVVRVHRTSFDSPTRALRAVTGEVAGAGSLIGTPAEVAETLDGYRALGIGAVRLAAWDTIGDVALHAELIDRVHALRTGTPVPA